MNPPTDPDVMDTVVIGAGITGLTAAFHLSRNNVPVQVLEASSNPGGVMQSERIGDFLVERGPNSLQKTSSVVANLFTSLNLDKEVCEARSVANNRFVFKEGKLHRFPTGPLSFLNTRLLSFRGKWNVLLEFFRKPGTSHDNETLSSLIERRFGSEVLKFLVNPFVAGVYAGSPERLEASTATAKVARWERRSGSILKGALASFLEPTENPNPSVEHALVSFRDGLQTLPRKIAEQLDEQIQYSSRVRSVQSSSSRGRYRITFSPGDEGHDSDRELRAQNVLLAVPAYEAARIINELNSSISSVLNAIEYPPLASVFFGYERYTGDRDLNGFGFLVPETENRRILGSLWNASIFPHRAPEEGAAMTTFVGGGREPDQARRSRSELVEIVYKELNDILGVERRPDFVRVQQWNRSIPQYTPGHGRRVDRIRRVEKNNPGLYIRGNFTDGVSVPACIETGTRTANEILSP